LSTRGTPPGSGMIKNCETATRAAKTAAKHMRLRVIFADTFMLTSILAWLTTMCQLYKAVYHPIKIRTTKTNKRAVTMVIVKILKNILIPINNFDVVYFYSVLKELNAIVVFAVTFSDCARPPKV